MKRLNKSGFSMIELLVVLLIIGILAAVAAPMFLQNTDKAKISEAVAALGSIREGERIYRSQNGSYYMANSSNTDYFGTGGSKQSNLGVLIHGNKYFSPAAFTVTPGAVTIGGSGSSATALDFTITADGANSVSMTTDPVDGARNNTEVSKFKAQMDNSGAIFYTTDSTAGTPVWAQY